MSELINAARNPPKRGFCRLDICADVRTGQLAVMINNTRITNRKDTGSWNVVLTQLVKKSEIKDAFK